MEMTSKHIYNSVVNGAYQVIKHRDVLNKINVFPVRDGDTGSNLSSMMRAIIHNAEEKETVRETMASIADAALSGARGNSGIIFAQYLTGLSETLEDGNTISIESYAHASHSAVSYAYEAVENPVEGTMITVMKTWGTALTEEIGQGTNLTVIFDNAYQRIQKALDKTKEQLAVLKKADVVDSGAKGFTYFIEGILYYVQTGEVPLLEEDLMALEPEGMRDAGHGDEGYSTYRYCTECLLQTASLDTEALKSHIGQMGDSLVVAGTRNKTRIHIHTDTPARLFDYLHAEGSILFQKVDDMHKQASIVNDRKSPIAIITDSIADIPRALCDRHQIHMVHLDILFEDRVYMDKLTIEPGRLLEISKNSSQLPTSSQPTPKQVENLLDYLSSYYSSAIVLPVSRALSGTYNSFVKAAKRYDDRDFRIHVLDTKQNSGAQGLLVNQCAAYIEKGMDCDEVITALQEDICDSKILVQVKHLDNMIKSGRLSVRAGKVAKWIGLKPIVTLDSNGEGALDSIAFSEKGSRKKLVRHMEKLLKKRKVDQYNVVHINNPDEGRILAELMTEIIGFPPAYITETSSIVAVGAGEGAVALSYILKKEA